MLILTRRLSESLVINDDIFMTLLGIKGNQVRLGIVAPAHVSVHREEVYRRILQEQSLEGVSVKETIFEKVAAQINNTHRNLTNH